jgi:hypothetical protein
MVWSDSGKTFTGPNCIRQLAVEARTPGVTYTVSMAKVQDGSTSSPKSPSDKIVKERLKGLLAS